MIAFLNYIVDKICKIYYTVVKIFDNGVNCTKSAEGHEFDMAALSSQKLHI